jgi:mannose-P-dolichol utilization defect protein 1
VLPRSADCPCVVQILNIMRSKSAEGLSIVSFELEIVGFLIASSYGYIMGLPFSAYGEATILLLQSIFLVVLVYKYARVPAARALTTTALFTGAASFLLSG